LASRDLLKLGQLYLNDGKWNGTQVISEHWVRDSTRAHVQIDNDTDYGYLLWLKTFQAGNRNIKSFYMSGMGGNKVFVLPELESVVVITSENFRIKNAHELSDTLLQESVLAALQ
jgi:CubicO group peptidase (beta-lactamase class C family)